VGGASLAGRTVATGAGRFARGFNNPDDSANGHPSFLNIESKLQPDRHWCGSLVLAVLLGPDQQHALREKASGPGRASRPRLQAGKTKTLTSDEPDKSNNESIKRYDTIYHILRVSWALAGVGGIVRYWAVAKSTNQPDSQTFRQIPGQKSGIILFALCGQKANPTRFFQARPCRRGKTPPPGFKAKQSWASKNHGALAHTRMRDDGPEAS